MWLSCSQHAVYMHRCYSSDGLPVVTQPYALRSFRLWMCAMRTCETGVLWYLLHESFCEAEQTMVMPQVRHVWCGSCELRCPARCNVHSMVVLQQHLVWSYKQRSRATLVMHASALRECFAQTYMP